MPPFYLLVLEKEGESLLDMLVLSNVCRQETEIDLHGDDIDHEVVEKHRTCWIVVVLTIMYLLNKSNAKLKFINTEHLVSLHVIPRTR